jgi:hypothetical protein
LNRKFIKKPLEIEAFRFGFDDAPLWCLRNTNVRFCTNRKDDWLEIKTLEGTMVADIGDYVIKGIKGELYSCKSDIFLASYDEVLDDYAKTMIGMC